jgi:hypothetical protein
MNRCILALLYPVRFNLASVSPHPGAGKLYSGE